VVDVLIRIYVGVGVTWSDIVRHME